MSFESIDHTLWWIVVGSRGGRARARILSLLDQRPMNANQLAEALQVNYHTITYHLNVLIRNRLVTAEGPKYGLLYFPSQVFAQNRSKFKKILDRHATVSDEQEDGESQVKRKHRALKIP